MIGLTIWRSSDFNRAMLDTLPLLEAVKPPVVNLHLWPNDATGKHIEQVKSILPNAEIWLSPGCNGLADNGLKEIEVQAKAWAKTTEKLGAKCLLLNLEGSALPGYPGWTSKDPAQLQALSERAKVLLTTLAGHAFAIGLTSHDCPEWHHLPWGALLGPESPVTVHAPQVYPGVKRPGANRKACQKRWNTVTAQWDRFVKRGVVKSELGPQGSGWVTYTQGWGATVDGTCWLLDQRDRGLVWASPTRLWAEGRAALGASCEVRRLAGDSAGAVARFQASKGLDADGIVGPKTLSVLGA
jgi:hypothetical protein